MLTGLDCNYIWSYAPIYVCETMTIRIGIGSGSERRENFLL